jgi:hypothetical protein
VGIVYVVFKNAVVTFQCAETLCQPVELLMLYSHVFWQKKLIGREALKVILT